MVCLSGVSLLARTAVPNYGKWDRATDHSLFEIPLDKSGPYPIYNFTSSGLTNVHAGWAKAVNSYRVGKSYAKLNFGLK